MVFDFPVENGKPCRSNGSKILWNEKLKWEFPEGIFSISFKDLLIIKNLKDQKYLF